MKCTLTALLALSFAAACTPTEPANEAAEPVAAAPPSEPAPPPAEDPDACKASTYASLIGKPLSDTGVPPASPDVRHIRPGDAVTEDYRLERLNIYVTADDIIEKVNCG